MRLAGLDPEGRISAARLAAPLIIQDFPHALFRRPAEVVALELIGCRLVKRQDNSSLL